MEHPVQIKVYRLQRFNNEVVFLFLFCNGQYNISFGTACMYVYKCIHIHLPKCLYRIGVIYYATPFFVRIFFFIIIGRMHLFCHCLLLVSLVVTKIGQYKQFQFHRAFVCRVHVKSN